MKAQFMGRKAWTEAYSTATEKPNPSNTGQQTQWTGPLRPNRKKVDVEQGHAHTPDHAKATQNKLARPTNSRRYTTSLEPERLEIAQTRSYSDREPYPESGKERQEMVILTLQNAAATKKSDDDFREIRWIHLQAEPEVNQMSFDDLKIAIAHAAELHNDELALALKVLMKVESTNGKPFVHGKYGKYLVPTVFRDNGSNLHLQPDEKPKYAIFFSLPYFDLRPLRKLDTVERNADIYPIRTLLQSHYRLASTEERDKKQVVRKLDYLKNDKVISLPELWCLMINKHTIITYAPVRIDSADGLFGRTIQAKPSKGPTHVRYKGPDGHRHSFLLAQCKTWAQLRQTIKIHDENFDYELKAKDGLIVSESNWLQMISQETSLNIDLSVDSGDSDSSSDSSTSADPRSDDETESEHEYVEIKPDVEIVEVRPDTHSQIIDDLVRNMLLREFKARITRPRSVSPVRRAETIGPSPSAKQFRDFGFEMRSDSPAPLPLRRSATVGFTPQPYVETELEDPVAPIPHPDRKQPIFSGTTPTAAPGVSSSPKIADVETLYDSEDTSYPYRSRRKNFHSRSLHRMGFPNHEPSRGQPHDRDRFSPTRPRRYSPSTPHMSRPSPKVENEEISPAAEPTDARKISRGRNRTNKHRGSRRGRGGLRRLERGHESPGDASDRPNHIFTWPTTQHHASIDSRIQGVVLSKEPASAVDNQGTGIGERTKRPSQPENAPSTYSLPRAKDSKQDDDALFRILEDASTELAGSGKSSENKCYEYIEGRTPREVENEMKRLLDIGPVEPDGAQDSSSINTQTVLDCKTEIVLIAKKIYEAFVPVDHPCSIREKYWGGVYLLLEDSNHQWVTEYPLVNDDGDAIKVESELSFIRARTSEFLTMIEYINGLCPSNDEQQKLRYGFPHALFKAFTNIVMFYILHGLARVERHPTYGPELSIAGNKCTDRCNDLLTEGLHQLLVILHTDDDGAIVSYEPLDSETIMALVMENLLDNPLRVETGEIEISELYSEYISELEIQTQEYASVGVFGEIKLLNDELDIIEKTLSKQLQIMLDYSQKVDVATDDNASDMQTYSTKLRKRVLDRSIKSLDQKIGDFLELKDRANYMQFSARQSISVRTESKEKAILIFTVVTVIFLPLSFITGYLGMNVEDIRNMGKTQSIFWVIATPITFVIASVVVLLVMGPNLKKRFLKARMK